MTIVKQLVLSTSFQTVLTVPDGNQLTISGIFISNTDTSARDICLCVIPPFGSGQQSTALLWNFPLAPNDFVEVGAGQILLAKFALIALASVDNVVTLRVSGT